MIKHPFLEREHLVLDPSEIRDLRPDVLGADGRMRILPAAYWATTTTNERALFGTRTGIYSFPTEELVVRLKELIAGRVAIEIGAGHGILAEALGIPGTDNYQHRMLKYRLVYETAKQPIVPYGPKVIEMHASRAVRHFRPQVVIGCWVTHKYDHAHPELEGNEIGVDEPDILRNCSTYIFVGNEHVHAQKPILSTRPSLGRKHVIEYPDYVYSRAHNNSRDFIATFQGLR